MGRFFALIRADQFDFNNPTDLLRLLVRMAQNKLRDHIRYQYAERRDARKITPGSSAVLPNVAGAGENPSSIVANQELLEAVRGQLSREELYLADQRAEGREWADLAAELGEKPDAVRRRLTRALDRAFKQLGLADPGSGD
jgi:DNA-directed RNA polymerase specialized sigma24 family protein